METSTLEGLIRDIRMEFFALRNGMIADTLRKGGLEQKYIFGLQLPQIKDMGVRYRPQSEEDCASLARALWGDRECREARLLASHLMPPSQITREEAEEWATEVSTREEADILAFRLLRFLPYAAEMAERLDLSEYKLGKYTSSAIRRFL